MLLVTVLFLLLLGCILTNSQTSLYYAAMGLNLWFQKMIPALLPFMILSGIMVRMKLTDKAAMILYPVIHPFFRVGKNVCYAMLLGFLCGFPMGARVTDDLYSRGMIGKREAQYLLAFCNNIGPVYFCSFALPLLGRKLILPYLFGMYGIPLLYGLLLRHTLYRDLPSGLPETRTGNRLVGCCLPETHRGNRLMGCCLPETHRGNRLVGCCSPEIRTDVSRKAAFWEKLLDEINDSVNSSLQNMLCLGGYMVLFNLFNIVPNIFLGKPLLLLSPLLEIIGGLTLMGNAFPLFSLLALSFGGFSCIAQTGSCIAGSDLSLGNYVLHKLLLTLLSGLFYLGWFLIQPSSFLL